MSAAWLDLDSHKTGGNKRKSAPKPGIGDHLPPPSTGATNTNDPSWLEGSGSQKNVMLPPTTNAAKNATKLDDDDDDTDFSAPVVHKGLGGGRLQAGAKNVGASPGPNVVPQLNLSAESAASNNNNGGGGAPISGRRAGGASKNNTPRNGGEASADNSPAPQSGLPSVGGAAAAAAPTSGRRQNSILMEADSMGAQISRSLGGSSFDTIGARNPHEKDSLTSFGVEMMEEISRGQSMRSMNGAAPPRGQDLRRCAENVQANPDTLDSFLNHYANSPQANSPQSGLNTSSNLLVGGGAGSANNTPRVPYVGASGANISPNSTSGSQLVPVGASSVSNASFNSDVMPAETKFVK